MTIPNASEQQIDNCIWINLGNAELSAAVQETLGDAYPGRVISGLFLGSGVSVGIAIVDDAHADLLDESERFSKDGIQSILVTANTSEFSLADFTLDEAVSAETICSIVTATCGFREREASLLLDIENQKHAAKTISSSQFEYRNLDEARSLATMLARACPESDLAEVGLLELLVNAVEHGNLGILNDEKQELLMAGDWRAEVERRLVDPKYRDRRVRVRMTRTPECITIVVEDEGDGFDYSGFLTKVEEGEEYSGLGISMALGLSFSSMTYSGRGNVVTVEVRLAEELAQAA
jgi:anti-sigma regulatory factor (Ser/Thr protein kinase)